MFECGRPDFPRHVSVLAGQAGRPIPALPRQSLCSSPQRKCQVWPLEGAQSSQDKEIFRLSPPPSSQWSVCTSRAGKCREMHRRGSCHRAAARLDKCLSFSQQGVSRPGSWEPGTVLKNSAFAGLAARQRGAAFDAGWGCGWTDIDRKTLDGIVYTYCQVSVYGCRTMAATATTLDTR